MNACSSANAYAPLSASPPLSHPLWRYFWREEAQRAPSLSPLFEPLSLIPSLNLFSHALVRSNLESFEFFELIGGRDNDHVSTGAVSRV